MTPPISQTKAAPKDVSRQALELARRLVDEYRHCLWFRHPDAAIETWDDCYLVVKRLREHGGRQGWADAQKLWKCL